MDSFEEWVKTADYFCFQQWGDKAVELGASWDTFRRRRDKDAIVHDLVQGGIPIMAARDMTEIAAAEVGKSQSPMAVFWDLENMPIPTDTSGRDITTSLKSILAPHGDLVQFRGYASIGLNNIPEEKRSDLQLSGCHLVDCPHHGRKEVADKMIIVDAMLFAFQHPDCATLCFITGDVDYAYLLAALQRPQWRTIVISRGTMQSMLHVNCDMKMRWETDILQPICGTQEQNETSVQRQLVILNPEEAPRTRGIFRFDHSQLMKDGKMTLNYFARSSSKRVSSSVLLPLSNHSLAIRYAALIRPDFHNELRSKPSLCEPSLKVL
jgi:NYN domain